jgi:hypothetical protein
MISPKLFLFIERVARHRGFKSTLRTPFELSALPPKADVCGATRDVRFGPKADIGLLSFRSVILTSRP